MPGISATSALRDTPFLPLHNSRGGSLVALLSDPISRSLERGPRPTHGDSSPHQAVRRVCSDTDSPLRSQCRSCFPSQCLYEGAQGSRRACCGSFMEFKQAVWDRSAEALVCPSVCSRYSNISAQCAVFFCWPCRWAGPQPAGVSFFNRHPENLFSGSFFFHTHSIG